MKQFSIILSLILTCLFAVVPYSSYASRLAKATVVVVNEEGKPIKGADAYIAHDGESLLSKIETAAKGKTDGMGRFSDTMFNVNGYLAYGARMDGYYNSRYTYHFSEGVGLKHWKPWNPELKVVLRKIGNPVPMYARKTDSLSIPVLGEPVGFDLIAFDWVPPYGSGSFSDLIFLIEKEVKGRRHFISKLLIMFSNEHDGILKVKDNPDYGSQLLLPKVAPEIGYEKHIELRFENTPEGGFYDSNDKDDNYIFRIRSKLDENGKLKSMYGKFIGPIKFEPRAETAIFIFKYYLNPDYSRNIEFDPEKNLFGELPPLEQVGIK